MAGVKISSKNASLTPGVAERMQPTIEGWRRRQRLSTHVAREKPAPYHSPSGYLKRRVYKLAQELIETESIELARAYAQSCDRRTAGETGSGPDLFRWLLAGVSDDDLSRSEKRRYAHELHYARRHRVPVEYLVGFLLQTGAGDDIYPRALDETRFESWHRPDGDGEN